MNINYLLDKVEKPGRYTGGEWGKSQNYHISLDSAALGIDKCVELIVGLAK